MEMLKGLAYEFWLWVPKSQFYGALGLTAVLWFVRQYALSRLVLIVAAVAWAVGFTISRSDAVAALGPNVLYFAMLAGAAAAVALFWFLFLRNP
jgi:hypothetical protein